MTETGIFVSASSAWKRGDKVIWMFNDRTSVQTVRVIVERPGRSVAHYSTSQNFDTSLRVSTLAGTRLRVVKFTYNWEVSQLDLLVVLFSLLLSILYKVQPEFVDPHQTDYIAAAGERVEMQCIVRPSVYPSASVAWNKHQGDLTKTVHLGENYAKQKAELKD